MFGIALRPRRYQPRHCASAAPDPYIPPEPYRAPVAEADPEPAAPAAEAEQAAPPAVPQARWSPARPPWTPLDMQVLIEREPDDELMELNGRVETWLHVNHRPSTS